MPSIIHTIYFIVNIFLSKVYNESCFKRNQHVSNVFLWIRIINYTQLYKSSHAVFYDVVSECRLVVLKLLTRQSTYKFPMIYGHNQNTNGMCQIMFVN